MIARWGQDMTYVDTVLRQAEGRPEGIGPNRLTSIAEDHDLMSQCEDLGGLLVVAHRYQPEQGERVLVRPIVAQRSTEITVTIWPREFVSAHLDDQDSCDQNR